MSPEYYEKYINSIDNEGLFGDYPEKYYHGMRRAVNKLKKDYYGRKMKKCLSIIGTEQSLIYSNWLEYGIEPISKTLEKRKITFDIISGSVDKDTRFSIVEI